jgi:hypothetical protein
VAVEIQDLATLGAAARIVSAYIDLNPVRAGMVEDPAEYPWCGYARALVGEKESAKGLLRVWGKQRGLKRALAEYRVYLFEEGSEEKTQDGETQDTRGEGAKRRGMIQDPKTGEMKPRMGIDARKVWEERKRGGRLPMFVMLRLKSRYLVDGAAIGSAEFLRRLTGKATVLGQPPESVSSESGEVAGSAQQSGRAGVPMRFGQWGGLRVLRDLRVNVVA